ncbi:XRN 5'-3' exonuclease N-terminus-domain-containing protein [Blyttiomyces helicus]|uniref:5'-3' exoribonuclease 1 n=1 Tax=Blyttiomyces helicus TaxID=388810 RepID=A0A4P9WIP2_9FUNG|nr:XRN 5'-3' exonuclease N-terminus-domain-containing protein [Blyttiomyces helicus]|eukprot:RKO92292.1 XRN 5'-3' exonuclease N-terminus-domain-containing protein [Blyttiomyces helicus]
MGVPKVRKREGAWYCVQSRWKHGLWPLGFTLVIVSQFFRWISERYPLCSQLIQENRIPEFDNLYLDMNGIIHNCSHPNDNDVHFRMTEDQIFLAIFTYIDHLFAKIKPQRLFFLAVDGVAPRAKMNQQRARRFRTAKDAVEAQKQALRRGEELPKEPPFDSNCITPGTPFMTRLQEQLKYFINKKVTEDKSWQGIEIILSGHEVPGEGEHKIMEYLRLAKSQPDYPPNLRHCLYGLDADLIMLGLLSHEPHFALLREEVTFGRTKKKAPGANTDAQNFYLMHLSLFREYLDLEFSPLKDVISFNYDLERIIDDFILMSYFVGNDFLPNLPSLHINEGALALMFKVYKQVVVETGGYLNDAGELNLARCEAMLRELAKQEREVFEIERGDVKWLKGKRPGPSSAKPAKNVQQKSQTVISTNQKTLYERIKNFVLMRSEGGRLTFPTSLPARDRSFIISVAEDLGLQHSIDALSGKKHHIILEWDDDDDESDEESNDARQRVLKKYDRAEVVDEAEIAANLKAEEEKKLDEAFLVWRKTYYKEKLEFDFDQGPDLEKLVFSYVEGLQWVLYYYYIGVPSWEWFYPYHYAPKITDLVNLDRFNFKNHFDIGRPFLPFEQLMGVLPAASSTHIPEAFRGLMTDPGSPILDFYPVDFECDMNGKKAEWEAVIKIPFIDEKRLLKALEARANQLTKEERSRNRHGNSFSFMFDPATPHLYKSVLPEVFPSITQCLCTMKVSHLPLKGKGGFKKGLCDGALLGARSLPGFPSLHTVPHTATLGFHGVNVFMAESKNESMVVTISNRFDGKTAEEIAKSKVGQRIYIGWPFLIEAFVTSLTDEYFRYEVREGGAGRIDVVKHPHSNEGQDRFYRTIDRVDAYYSKRCGTLLGPIEFTLQVRVLKGMKLQEDGSLAKDFGPDDQDQDVALQTVIDSLEMDDPRYKEKPPPPVEEEFPLNSHVFFLGYQKYGSEGEVTGYDENNVHIRLLVNAAQTPLETATRSLAREAEREERYSPSWAVAKQTGISSMALSKVASNLHVISKKGDQRFNVGLCLKFDGKKRKVLGYSRKSETGWEYSGKAADLISRFQARFPEFVAGLERRNRNDFYEDTDFYPPEVAAERMAEIKEWLKAEGIRDLEKVSLDTRALTKEYVRRVEETVDQTLVEFGATKGRPMVVKNVPRQSVLKPAHSKHRLSGQVFDLGDRVVHVLDVGTAPLGAKGTVVGIEGSFCDIVFDVPFMGGNTLEDR